MSTSEQVHVKLGISGTFWNRRPQYQILINDDLIKAGEIVADCDEVEYIEFDAKYSTDVATLKVQFLGKTNADVQKDNSDPVDFKIINDMLLNIVSLEIDEIDLGPLLYTVSEYYTDEPVTVTWQNGETTQLIKNCVNLGWNGTWQISWDNPFYIWLLENI